MEKLSIVNKRHTQISHLHLLANNVFTSRWIVFRSNVLFQIINLYERSFGPHLSSIAICTESCTTMSCHWTLLENSNTCRSNCKSYWNSLRCIFVAHVCIPYHCYSLGAGKSNRFSPVAITCDRLKTTNCADLLSLITIELTWSRRKLRS